MTDKKTIAIFGAGSGLGASLAEKFGREGYKVALVARNAATLDDRVKVLEQSGIEAVSFPADLTSIEGLAPLVRSIEERMGSIDAAVYAPFSRDSNFVPAADLDAAKLQSLVTLFTFAPVELVHALLPNMVARGDGAVVVVGGLSAVVPIPNMSGMGPLMAATRNYMMTLNAEVADKGVYAGTMHVGALINNSTGKRAMDDAGIPIGDSYPMVEPEELAQVVWDLITKRDQVDVVVPALQHA